MNNYLDKTKNVIEFIKELILAVLLALLFTSFIVSHNKIPTESMVDTINIGDHMLTNMLPYYYRDPYKGEIVVFKQGEERWVKRVIGEPGETIDIQEGNVYINGVRLNELEYLSEEGISTPSFPTSIIFPYTIPEGEYFLMGDNRPASGDSRYIGSVKRENIYGKGWVKIYPLNQLGLLK